MADPLVVAICLVNGRPEMVRRAILSFQVQAYAEKRLLIYDTSTDQVNDLADFIEDLLEDDRIVLTESNARNHHGDLKTIGYLRNRANAVMAREADILMHWDSDDWSHPLRMEEQVNLLRGYQVEACGYNRMLFWNTWLAASIGPRACIEGEAWWYDSNVPFYCLGTSLCYWCKVWERQPFEDLPHFKDGQIIDCSEDLRFQQNLRRATLPSLADGGEPRMIAAIHGGNTSGKIQPELREWQRAPDWDTFCREKMQL